TAVDGLSGRWGSREILFDTHGLVSDVVARVGQSSSRGASWISSQVQQGLQTLQSTHWLQGGLM
ncbi:hypothetical protein, partial [Streptomyces sp. NPDC017890]